MQLKYLKHHPEKLKICKNCGSLNYYKNYKCVVCKNRFFIKNKDLVIREIMGRYEFYKVLNVKRIDYVKEEIKARL